MAGGRQPATAAGGQQPATAASQYGVLAISLGGARLRGAMAFDYHYPDFTLIRINIAQNCIDKAGFRLSLPKLALIRQRLGGSPRAGPCLPCSPSVLFLLMQYARHRSSTALSSHLTLFLQDPAAHYLRAQWSTHVSSSSYTHMYPPPPAAHYLRAQYPQRSREY